MSIRTKQIMDLADTTKGKQGLQLQITQLPAICNSEIKNLAGENVSFCSVMFDNTSDANGCLLFDNETANQAVVRYDIQAKE